MASAECPPADLPVPQVSIEFVPATVGEILMLGAITIRVMEDGSHIGNRLGAIEIICPPHTNGPGPPWHEMHDGSFFITQGAIHFHTIGHRDARDFDAKCGDYVVVPVQAPHTFSNPFDEESKMFSTMTPGCFVNYFKLLSQLADGGPVTPERANQAMATYATLSVTSQGKEKAAPAYVSDSVQREQSFRNRSGHQFRY